MCLGIPGEILEITGNEPLNMTAQVSFGGAVKTVNLAGVPDAKVGDYVIVHAGFALNTLNKDEAEEVYGYLRQIAEFADEELDGLDK